MPRLASHFGSTAHDIVLRARCPVLTVRVPRTEGEDTEYTLMDPAKRFLMDKTL